jgi:uncharacterized damage-inducible protein DinB
MRTMKVLFAVAGLMISGVALGQGSPFPGEIQGNYARIKANVIKAAEKMPPEDYSFKPTPDIRTFARVVNHVTEAQMHICGASNGAASSDAKMPAETADKAAIVEALKASFAECDKAYAGLTDANAAELLAGAGPAKRSRLSMLWGNVAHDNEQYATLSLYLRLKGLVPPSSEK